MNLLELHNQLNRPLVLDGAIGSYLEQKNYIKNDVLWSARALLEHPGKVFELHCEYVAAGCDIATTNTFRTNPSMLQKSYIDSLNSKKLVNEAVSIAKSAVKEKEVILAGSNPPAEDCYQTERTITNSELEKNHYEHISNLAEAGVDIIWNETHSHFDEIELICEFCHSNSLDYAINLFFTVDGKILSGEPIHEIANLINDYTPAAIGFNCISPNVMNSLSLEELKLNHWGFYLNCGSGNVTDAELKTGITPNQYVEEIQQLLHYNPVYIGSCCGSTPEHTRKIREAIFELRKN